MEPGLLSILGNSQQVDPGPPVHQGSAARTFRSLNNLLGLFLSCLLSFFVSIVSCRASLFSSYVRDLLSQLTFPHSRSKKERRNIYKSSLKICKNVVNQCVKELVCFALLCFLRVMSICHPLVGSNRAILVRTNTRVFEAVLVLFTS